MQTMTNSNQSQTEARLVREHGFTVDPRTGDIIMGATECRMISGNRKMPPISNKHLNRCPRVAYHRRVNQPQGISARGVTVNDPTGQYATVWGERKHGYVSKAKLDGATAPRWIGVAAPKQQRMKRRWR